MRWLSAVADAPITMGHARRGPTGLPQPNAAPEVAVKYPARSSDRPMPWDGLLVPFEHANAVPEALCGPEGAACTLSCWLSSDRLPV